MPEDQTPKSTDPSVEIIYPSAQEKKSPLVEFAPEIKDLLRNDPETTKRFLFMVLDGMKADQGLRSDQQKCEFELKNKESEQSHLLSRAKETTTRLILGAITLAFAGSLGYSFIYKDTSLADKVFTSAMAIAGGAGGALALSQKKDQEPKK
jgi:hypothetical protein